MWCGGESSPRGHLDRSGIPPLSGRATLCRSPQSQLRSPLQGWWEKQVDEADRVPGLGVDTADARKMGRAVSAPPLLPSLLSDFRDDSKIKGWGLPCPKMLTLKNLGRSPESRGDGNVAQLGDRDLRKLMLPQPQMGAHRPFTSPTSKGLGSTLFQSTQVPLLYYPPPPPPPLPPGSRYLKRQ